MTKMGRKTRKIYIIDGPDLCSYFVILEWLSLWVNMYDDERVKRWPHYVIVNGHFLRGKLLS